MKKITINFDYHIPEKKEAYNYKKMDIIENLIREKEKMKSYLVSKQDEINETIDELIKGTNVTEAENFLSEVSSTTKDEYFSYIGENKQEKVNEIYLAYREVMKGMKTLEIFQDNEIFENEDEKIFLIKEELMTDIKELNNLMKKEGYSVRIEINELIIDKDTYEDEICKILTSIKNKVTLKVV